MTKQEERILLDATKPWGAASYLFPKTVARLLRRGLVETRNEHSVKITEAGRRLLQG